jgi:hypothetical protein
MEDPVLDSLQQTLEMAKLEDDLGDVINVRQDGAVDFLQPWLPSGVFFQSLEKELNVQTLRIFASGAECVFINHCLDSSDVAVDTLGWLELDTIRQRRKCPHPMTTRELGVGVLQLSPELVNFGLGFEQELDADLHGKHHHSKGLIVSLLVVPMCIRLQFLGDEDPELLGLKDVLHLHRPEPIVGTVELLVGHVSGRHFGWIATLYSLQISVWSHRMNQASEELTVPVLRVRAVVVSPTAK